MKLCDHKNLRSHIVASAARWDEFVELLPSGASFGPLVFVRRDIVWKPTMWGVAWSHFNTGRVAKSDFFGAHQPQGLLQSARAIRVITPIGDFILKLVS